MNKDCRMKNKQRLQNEECRVQSEEVHYDLGALYVLLHSSFFTLQSAFKNLLLHSSLFTLQSVFKNLLLHSSLCNLQSAFKNLLLHSSFFTLQSAFLFFFSTTLSAQQRFEYVQPKMGTQFKLIFYANNQNQADSVATLAFAEVDKMNSIFSDYDGNSELRQLTQHAGNGQKIKVSNELWEVLKFSKQLSKKSKGAYDISIGTLSKIWRRAFRRSTFPDVNKIYHAQSLVNYRWIKLYKKTKTVRLKKEGMRLDAGGIAKGYTVDKVFKCLQKNGIQSAIIDGGGDIYIGQQPPNDTSWSIATINQPTQQLENIAIASSGDTYRFLEHNGKRYSHIIDPRTGYGVQNRPIITVTAPNCMIADALASTLSVLDEKERQKFIKKFPDCRFF